MSKIVLDASAFLAMANRETGAEVVVGLLKDSVMSAVNAAEVVQKLTQKGMSLDSAEDYLRRFVGEVKSYTLTHATLTASLSPLALPLGLSLADRACLALAKHMNLPVLTADQVWSKLDIGVTVEVIRHTPSQ